MSASPLHQTTFSLWAGWAGGGHAFCRMATLAGGWFRTPLREPSTEVRTPGCSPVSVQAQRQKGAGGMDGVCLFLSGSRMNGISVWPKQPSNHHTCSQKEEDIDTANQKQNAIREGSHRGHGDSFSCHGFFSHFFFRLPLVPRAAACFIVCIDHHHPPPHLSNLMPSNTTHSGPATLLRRQWLRRMGGPRRRGA